MKLLLTSGGIENDSMIGALRNLLGKAFQEARLVFIPTASNIEVGDKSFLIRDLQKCKELGFQEVDIVDIAAVSRDIWEPRLRHADVLVMGGGNASYLMSKIKESGLGEIISDVLKSRVYVGISAGSMVVAPNLREKEMQKLYEEVIIDDNTNEGLGLVDFLVVPHMNNPYFPRRASQLIDEIAKDITTPLYAIDDQTAIQVIDGVVEVISEGKWKRFN